MGNSGAVISFLVVGVTFIVLAAHTPKKLAEKVGKNADLIFGVLGLFLLIMGLLFVRVNY